jgi:hypothetical protein
MARNAMQALHVWKAEIFFFCHKKVVFGHFAA